MSAAFQFSQIAIRTCEGQNTKSKTSAEQCDKEYSKIPVIRLGFIQFREGFWVGLYPGDYIQERGGGGGHKKDVSRQVGNKTYFIYISLADQVRNSNCNCSRNITKQEKTLISDSRKSLFLTLDNCSDCSVNVILFRQQVKEGGGGLMGGDTFNGIPYPFLGWGSPWGKGWGGGLHKKWAYKRNGGGGL